MLALGLSLLLSAGLAHADIPPAQQFGNPAFLLDYNASFAADKKFLDSDSETRAFGELVRILYDFDNQRPWGKEYFPEANRRLTAFRQKACSAVPLKICLQPFGIADAQDVAQAQVLLGGIMPRLQLERRWNLKIAPVRFLGTGPEFNLLVGESNGSEKISAQYWNMAGQVNASFVKYDLLPDAATYRAAFDDKDFPAYISLADLGPVINDWRIGLHAIEMAKNWKHVVDVSKHRMPTNPIVDSMELQFLALREARAAEFAAVYAELRARVEGVSDVRARFEKERQAGDYPEEVYQRIANRELLAIAKLEASYFYLALNQRSGVSPRQQALEALLVVQRFSADPRVFAIELTTLAQPLASHAYVLDQAADFSLAITFVLENLKVVLGMGEYEGKALFPAAGAGLLAAELFNPENMKDVAPEALAALGGRDFAKLDSAEQLKILQLYLAPSGAKSRAMAVVRLGNAFLTKVSSEELRVLADRIHAVRFK